VIFTYDTLKASLQSWRDDTNTEFVAAIDDMIGKAELRILRDLNLTIFDQTLTTAMVTSDREVTKPADMIFTRSLWVIDGAARVEIFPRTKSWCLDYAPDVTVEDRPGYYYEESDALWYVVNTPDDDYDVETLASIRPAPMAADNQDTWVGTNVGDLLHECSLQEACRYLKKFAEIDGLEAKYQALLGIARLEMRSLIRSDYSPLQSAAQVIQ
jgi:hypothetical protein